MSYRHIFMVSLLMISNFAQIMEGPTQSKLKKKFSVDKRRNDLKSHTSRQCETKVLCVVRVACLAQATFPWTTGVASPSGDVKPNPHPPPGSIWRREESTSVLISPLKSRQSSAVPGTCLTFSLLWLVQFVACTWTPVRC